MNEQQRQPEDREDQELIRQDDDEQQSQVTHDKTPEERHAENLRKAEEAAALAPPIDGSADEGTRDETGRVVQE